MTGSATPLTSAEAVLWTIERDPVLRSTIVAIAVLDRSPDLDRLRERMHRAVEAFPRLTQCVEPALAGVPHWVDAPALDLDHHFTHVELPRPGSMRQLLDLAGEQAGEAFDPARPLWHLTLFDGIEGGRSALVMKVHHAMTDGVGGVGLLPIFTDLEPCPATEPDLAAARTARPASHGHPWTPAATALGKAVTDPVAALTLGPRFAWSTAKLLAPAGRSRSPLTTARGLDRHLDVLDVPLEDLGRAGHAVHGTMNDAFLAAVVGGLRRYHELHGESPAELRVTMPINVRRAGDGPGGNRFTPARFSVPVTIDDPAARMEALGEIARAWRHEPAIGLTDVLAAVLSHLPDQATTSIFGSMLKGIDFVATNVPGSRERRWLAGAEVLDFYGFGPTSGAAVSIALLSHVDSCGIGINVDTAAIPDPEELRTCLAEGFAEVVGVGRAAPSARSAPPRGARAASTNERRGLSALDASFLEAETPRTPMHIGALLLLDGAPLLDRRGRLRIGDVRAEIASHLARCPRMGQRAVAVPLGRPRWEDDPDFDVANHVRRVRLARPGTREQLEQLCCKLQMQVLDRSRPLWEMWFVDGLADGSVGLIYKVHHAVVDGVSAAETFEVLLAPGPSPTAISTSSGARAGPARLVGAVADELGAMAQRWTDGRTEFFRDPCDVLRRAVGLTHLVKRSALAPSCSLNQPVGDRRLLASRTFPVDQLKTIGRQHGAKVNDVVLALVASGLGSWLATREERPDHLVALVPVSLRSDGQHDGVGNKVAALMVPLLVGEPDPVACLRAVTAETQARKAGPDAAALDLLLRWSDTWPIGILGPASRRLVHQQPFVNLVVTNVRGSEHPLSLLGAEITEIVPIVPLGGNLSLGVAALSYRGQLVIAVHADADACPDLDVVVDGIDEAFATLLASGR